jgi:hypothetical protein
MYTSTELVNSIIVEMYEMFKALVAGNYAVFCSGFTDIMSKLTALRKGIDDDKAAKDTQIEDLKAQIQRLRNDAESGITIGGGTETYNYDPRTDKE